MSLNIIKKPELLHPVFSDDNDFIFYDSEASGGVEWIYSGTVIKSTSLITSQQSMASNVSYEVVVTVNGNTRTFEIFADLRGIGTFNPRYLLSDYMESELVDGNALLGYITNGILNYSVSIKYYKAGSLVSTKSLGNFKCYNGTSQIYNPLDISKYIPTNGKTSRWLNKYKGGIYININDKLTLQAFTGVSGLESNGYKPITSITLREYYKDSTGKIVSRSATKSISVMNKLGIANINVSPSLWGMSSDVLYYDVHTSDDLLDTVRVYIEETNKLVKRRYRLSYINSNGATDYFNFTAADTEKLNIKRSEFTNNYTREVYKTEANSTITVRSRYMSELKGFELKDLWVSPKVKVQVIENYGNYVLNEYDVIINDRSKDILRDHELVSYIVSFSYKTEQNIQR